ncbi:hypothetical protein PR202_ga23767 [Eleusine coracana subsp. coracana]|uniref:Uncharacterized protein n=1 Tax=Eleusine coracana subsp. coracana TaxID=191504 RepID=A0AAV5D723_ELECO|nr:hypothetical protein PR202_ga23767 [Eleusine coracana subsp. coracana]
MAGAATSRDVEEVIQKLHSDRARTRDVSALLLGNKQVIPACSPTPIHQPFPSSPAGRKVKLLLGTWLQGNRAASFCRLLGRNTVRLKPGHLAGAATWPLLILALLNCVKEDISGKKRGAVKSAAARMLRVAIQCAEDVRLSGFVTLFMKKVAIGFDAKSSNQATSKDDSFRCALTLHVLLENPPGDYPNTMREEILDEFCAIFSRIRQAFSAQVILEEGKLTRKLMECVNTLLRKDGPNLGYKSVEIHNTVQDFVFRFWLRTHDQALKSLFITYAKLQLKLARAIPEVLEKLVDIIIKELDQNVYTGAGFLWCEAPRDEKAGSLRCFQEEWMDLCATVFYLAYKCTPKTPNREKRLKTEHIANLIMDGLLKGSLFCILSNANAVRFQDSLLWLVRALKEFSIMLRSYAEDAQFCLTKAEADSALSLLGGMIVWVCFVFHCLLLLKDRLSGESAGPK